MYNRIHEEGPTKGAIEMQMGQVTRIDCHLSSTDPTYIGSTTYESPTPLTADVHEGFEVGILLTGARNFVEVFATEVVNAPSGQSYQHFSLAVDDIEPTVSELRPRGVEVTEPKKGNDQSWQAWLADPDGNRIELHQYTPESWQTPSLI